MSSAATVKQDEFTTPARPEIPEGLHQTKDNFKISAVEHTGNVVNHVTPLDPQKETVTEAIRATVTNSPTTTDKSAAAAKQVRFNASKDTKQPVTEEKKIKEEVMGSMPRAYETAPTSPNQQKKLKRGLVSRRGGRYGGSRSPPEPVTEYKTFRSPNRKAHDEVPSLCSSHSEVAAGTSTGTAPAASISCDPSTSATSPLASTASAAAAVHSPKRKVEGTPTRGFHTLSTADDVKFMMSPGGPIFLSPGDKLKPSMSPAHTDRDHAVRTPTDFSLDYGKNQNISGGSFDTSNVLAWLQSPTANGLFSPGGYGSILNTPGGGGGPRTPRTPTVSTSFFFSDVAGLPRGEEASTPNNSKTKEDDKRKGISNIICISPLASSKARSGSTPLVNLKDVFASPQERSKIRSLPLLQDSATKDRPRISQRGSKDPSVDAVHLAERDLMEDEDMSVLLQLASNTPHGGVAAGPVFRSPNPSSKQAVGVKKDENLPALQLPMIGGQDGSRKAHGGDNAFAPPQLGMRSGSGSGKEIVAGKSRKNKKDDKGENDKKVPGRSYPMHPPYPPHRGDMPYYPMNGIPPGMPPGGSMRVAIGGPQPKGTPPRGALGTSSHGPPSHYHDYPYPPPPGMYPQYNHGHGHGPPPMGYPHYQGHYPPPPPAHMQMYGAQKQQQGQQQQSQSSSNAGKKSKSAKKVGKRSSPLLGSKLTKKQRKSPPSSTKKKKPSDRQNNAASARAVNVASGGKNEKAAALAAAILRGVTMRPSGKWQAQLYFAGKSRYIGVFDSREKAALAYEIAREKLKSGSHDSSGQSTENLVNSARKAAFEGVNERFK